MISIDDTQMGSVPVANFSAGTEVKVGAKARVIGIVGGVERSERLLDEAAQGRGHSLHFHAGHMNGTGDRALATLVQRSDLIVVTTDVNSHAAVRRARELARQHQRPCVLVRRLGPARLTSLLDELDEEGDCSRAFAPVANAA
jgi:hypothetical protein